MDTRQSTPQSSWFLKIKGDDTITITYTYPYTHTQLQPISTHTPTHPSNAHTRSHLYAHIQQHPHLHLSSPFHPSTENPRTREWARRQGHDCTCANTSTTTSMAFYHRHSIHCIVLYCTVLYVINPDTPSSIQ
ncbi:hypothetical protein IAQ61_004895 [Plenodomus lingam]|uniref:uncharacterized protein n=1 Tax=Leptosphaeria maculans TaxID=5022 RepID=UPI003326E96F|nr:hypothetical protein IAQ61_004895 [Plenodomus lingam]